MKRTELKRRYRPAVSPRVRRALALRSGGRCEMRLDGCWGVATDPCHRVGSQAGGRHGAAKGHHDRLSNVVHGCRSCHSWCHAHVDEAKKLGLILEQHEVAEDKPVMLPGLCPMPVYLDNNGGYDALPERVT